MSTPNQFSKVYDEIEQRFKEYSRHFSRYDGMKKDLLDFADKLLEFKEKQSVHSEIVLDVQKQIKNFNEFVEQKTQPIIKDQIKHLAFYNQLVNDNNALRATLAGLFAEVDSVRAKLVDHERFRQQISALEEKLEASKKELSDKAQEIKSSTEAAHTRASQLSTQMSALSSQLAQQDSKRSELNVYVDSFKNEMLKFIKDHNEDRRSLFPLIDKKIFDSATSLQQKIDSLNIPNIGHLASKEDVGAFVKRIEAAELDSRNAGLRSVNNDTQIQAINKKIENLQLQLKKLELAN